jgi:hypothetical protein
VAGAYFTLRELDLALDVEMTLAARQDSLRLTSVLPRTVFSIGARCTAIGATGVHGGGDHSLISSGR